jgi:DNA-binding response OmpR family regulator
MPSPVFAVDRDRAALSLLNVALSSRGFELVASRTSADAVARAHAWSPCVILAGLDVEGGAPALIRRLRADVPLARTPVLALARRGQETEIAAALEAGGMGCVFVPGDEDVVAERVREAAAWRLPAGRERVVECGPVALDVATRSVLRPFLPHGLAPCEFEMLRWLLAPAGRAYTRRQLMAADRAAFPPGAGERRVDAVVGSLRAKLGPAGEWIEGLPGIGWRFSATRVRIPVDNP